MARTVNPRPTRRLVLIGAGLVLGLAACSSAGGGDTLDAKAFGEAIAKPGVTILDVRTPEEFAAGHVEGAVNLPVQELERRMDEVPSDAEVVVYCRSGARSAAAAELLVARGRRVHDLGPMSAW